MDNHGYSSTLCCDLSVSSMLNVRFTTTECARRLTPTYMWREQAKTLARIYVTYVSFWELIIAFPNSGQRAPFSKVCPPLAQTSSYVTVRRGAIQYRIDNSSKCSNSFGPRAFWGLAILYIEFVLNCMQGWILEFRCPMQTLKKGPIFSTCYTKTSFAESKFNLSFCLGICFCVNVHFTLQIV